MNRSDTIFALASAPGRAGVGVVRVSGTAARNCLKALTNKDEICPRRAVLTVLKSCDGQTIDQALALWFDGPNSFTGEDVVEFHVHGGRAVLSALFDALQSLPGLRPAEPGEFSRRAVENGKFDLTQAEAIADLVDAETEAQRRQALRQYGGALGVLYGRWRADLVSAQALAEAAIDFSDEEIPDDVLGGARAKAADVLRQMQSHLDDAKCGELVREGLKLAVIGPPNVGKSSLVNALVKREVSIVSAVAGTTRDVIDVRLNLGGYAFVLSDTAGLRESGDEIEAEGVRRALIAARSADVVLLVRDGSMPAPFDLPEGLVDEHMVVVWNKSDLPSAVSEEGRASCGVRVSARTGEGVDALIDVLAKMAEKRLYRPAVSLTRPRHRAALVDGVAALTRAQNVEDPELFAEDLRLASRAIGRIVGVVDVDEILDVVFRDFCIGK